jgi:hypothetical protein
MTSVVNLVTKSNFVTFFVNFRFWTQLLVTVFVTRSHDVLVNFGGVHDQIPRPSNPETLPPPPELGGGVSHAARQVRLESGRTRVPIRRRARDALRSPFFGCRLLRIVLARPSSGMFITSSLVLVPPGKIAGAPRSLETTPP